MTIPSALFAHLAAFRLVQCSSYAKPKEFERNVSISSASLCIRFKCYFKCPAFHVSHMRYEQVCKHFFFFFLKRSSYLVIVKHFDRAEVSSRQGSLSETAGSEEYQSMSE